MDIKSVKTRTFKEVIGEKPQYGLINTFKEKQKALESIRNQIDVDKLTTGFHFAYKLAVMVIQERMNHEGQESWFESSQLTNSVEYKSVNSNEALKNIFKKLIIDDPACKKNLEIICSHRNTYLNYFGDTKWSIFEGINFTDTAMRFLNELKPFENDLSNIKVNNVETIVMELNKSDDIDKKSTKVTQLDKIQKIEILKKAAFADSQTPNFEHAYLLAIQVIQEKMNQGGEKSRFEIDYLNVKYDASTSYSKVFSDKAVNGIFDKLTKDSSDLKLAIETICCHRNKFFKDTKWSFKDINFTNSAAGLISYFNDKQEIENLSKRKQASNEQIAANAAAKEPIPANKVQLTGGIDKIYSNAYDNQAQTAGAFTDMLTSIRQSQKHVLIVGWAVCLAEPLDAKGLTLLSVILEKVKEEKNKNNKDFKIRILSWEQNQLSGYKKDVDLGFTALQQAIIKYGLEGYIEMTLASYNPTSPLPSFYSHHQKMLIVDDHAYLGGLDFAPGRNDDSSYLQPSPNAHVKENWHDIHLKMSDKSAVQQAVNMFVARWQVAKSLSNLHELKNLFAERQPPNISLIYSLTPEENKRLRALENKKDKPQRASLSKNNIQIQCTNLIGQAEKSIYIETQFLIGTGNDHKDSKNELPSEIVKKVSQKIKDHKDFKVTIVLPRSPNGDPNSLPNQSIARHQWKTIEWMVNQIIIENQRIFGETEDAKDALNALSKYIVFKTLEKDNKTIYTHSKMMIIDSKTAYIGSANFNERSLLLGGDTEVGIIFTNEKQLQQFGQGHQASHAGFMTDWGIALIKCPFNGWVALKPEFICENKSTRVRTIGGMSSQAKNALR